MAKQDIRKVVRELIQTVHDQHDSNWVTPKHVKTTQTVLDALKDLKKTIQAKKRLMEEIEKRGRVDTAQDTVRDKAYEGTMDEKLELQKWDTHLFMGIKRLDTLLSRTTAILGNVDLKLPTKKSWDSHWSKVWPAKKIEFKRVLDEQISAFEGLKKRKETFLRLNKLKSPKDQRGPARDYVDTFNGEVKSIEDKVTKLHTDLDTFLGLPALEEFPYKPYVPALPTSVSPSDLSLPAKPLAKGSFGEVYKVKGKHDTPPTAFKRFFDSNGKKGSGKKEMEREIFCYEAVGEHPNIAKCYGKHTIDGKEGMAMELMEGGSLVDIFKKLGDGRKNGEVKEVEYWAATQHMMKGLLQALAHMEKVGFVHSDLKPGNVGFSRDFTTKVFDLGAGGGIGDKFKAGTMAYADMGMMSSSAPLNPKYDIFATGHMIHELMEGKEFTYRSDKKGMLFLFDADNFFSDTSNRVLIEIDKPKELDNKMKALDKKLGEDLKALKARASGKELSREDARKEGLRLIRERDGKAIELREEHMGKHGKYQTEYVKFLNKLMHPDPARRLSAAEALEHPFMKDSLMETEKQKNAIFGKILPDLAPPEVDPEPTDKDPVYQPTSKEVEDLAYEGGLSGSSPQMQKTMKARGRLLTPADIKSKTQSLIKSLQGEFSKWRSATSKIKGVPKRDRFKTIRAFHKVKPWKKKAGTRANSEAHLDLIRTLIDHIEKWYSDQGREGKQTPANEKGMTRQQRMENSLGLYKSDKKVDESLRRLKAMLEVYFTQFRENLLMWEGFEEE